MAFETKMRTFQELLIQGINNFEKPNENITGLEPETLDKYSDVLKRINNYMYTTYSTHLNVFKTMSIEGVVPLNIFERMKPLLNENYYFYRANNPLTKEMYANKIIPKDEYDPEIDKYTIAGWVTYEHSEILRSEWWKKICSYEDLSFCVNEDVVINHLNPLNPYEPSNEVLGYVNEDLFKGDNPLISILIEDPVVGRVSLYYRLLDILEKVHN